MIPVFPVALKMIVPGVWDSKREYFRDVDDSVDSALIFVFDGVLELLPLPLSFVFISLVECLLAIGIHFVHFKFFLQISLHVLELIIEFDLKGLTGDLIEVDVNSHG